MRVVRAVVVLGAPRKVVGAFACRGLAEVVVEGRRRGGELGGGGARMVLCKMGR